MIKQCLRILCVLIAMAGFGVVAHGQTVDRIDVKIPREFVVNGKTLPPGDYTVSRVFESSVGVIVLSSYENRVGVVVMPAESESSPSEKVYIRLDQIGDQYFLTMIQTGEHLFSIPVSRKAKMEAAQKSQGTATAPAPVSISGNK